MHTFFFTLKYSVAHYTGPRFYARSFKATPTDATRRITQAATWPGVLDASLWCNGKEVARAAARQQHSLMRG